MGRLANIVFGCALFVVAAGTAQAQPRIQPQGGDGGTPSTTPGALLPGASVDVTLNMLKEAGYSEVEIYTSRNGNKHVSGKIEGLLVSAMHLHCNQNNVCPALAYAINFGKQDTIDTVYMDAWNRQKLYARLFKSTEGDLFLQQDVLVRDVPAVYIKHTAQMFGLLVQDLLKFKPGQN